MPPSRHILLSGRQQPYCFTTLSKTKWTHTNLSGSGAAKKRILLPVVVGDDLELRLYTRPEDLKPGAYGIEEPTGELFTDYADIDFIAVPGVAFDRNGNRLGRGKGYYDRLLPRIPSAYKAGICFPFQLVEEVPAEPFDIRMDEIITQ